MPTPAASPTDAAFSPAIELALQGLDALAALAEGLSDPNPRVACRLLLADGRMVEGHTQQAGGPHAEVMALRAAQAAGADTRGATALVTLEPCSHHGRTPPCCDALVAAGVARVVVALPDPNPLVNGAGVARLRAAGVQVDVLPPDHPVAVAARERNIGFLTRMATGLPWVRLKMAASLDGTTALHNGVSQWITSEAARTDGHAWRRRAGALLTGMGTVAADNPRLDVRLVPMPVPAAMPGTAPDTASDSAPNTVSDAPPSRQPLRVVIDSKLELAPDARIVAPPGQVLVFTTACPTESASRRAALVAAGVDVVDCGPEDEPPPAGNPAARPKVDLTRALRLLAARGVNELHLEAGHKLGGSFLREGLVDELLLYLAPKLLGPGAGLANIGPFHSLDQALNWRFHRVDPVGPDLRILARKVVPVA